MTVSESGKTPTGWAGNREVDRSFKSYKRVSRIRRLGNGSRTLPAREHLNREPDSTENHAIHVSIDDSGPFHRIKTRQEETAKKLTSVSPWSSFQIRCCSSAGSCGWRSVADPACWSNAVTVRGSCGMQPSELCGRIVVLAPPPTLDQNLNLRHRVEDITIV